MASSDSAAQRRVRPQDEKAREHTEAQEASTVAAARARVDDVRREAEDILNDIDDALRASLGLDRTATDEEFEKRAKDMLAEYQQKGGE